MNKYLFRTFLLAACLLAALSCKPQKKQLLPNVSGKAGEILVIIERDQWEGDLGVAIRTTLADDTPYLAQREPLFNLSNVPSGSFNNMFKMHRNMLVVNINPQNVKTGMVYKNNQWARPQAIAQLNALDEAQALEIFQPVLALTGGILHFPSGYKLRKRTDDFLWIADEKQSTNQTVLVYTYPVSGPDVFTLEQIIAARNTVMQANVPGMFDGSYMTTSTAVEPTTRPLRYHGIDFMETRGFWEVHGDYMGGPFVSHSFYSQDGKSVIVLEAFVYAPRYDKRQYLRQVESILYSFEWKK